MYSSNCMGMVKFIVWLNEINIYPYFCSIHYSDITKGILKTYLHFYKLSLNEFEVPNNLLSGFCIYIFSYGNLQSYGIKRSDIIFEYYFLKSFIETIIQKL